VRAIPSKEINLRALLTSSYAGSPRVFRAANVLMELGMEVVVVEWDRTGKLPARDSRDGVQVIRYRRKAPFGVLALPHLLLWMTWLLALMLRENFDLVQAKNLDSLLPAIIARALKGFILIYDMADFYADSHIRIPLLRQLVAWIERSLVVRVDLLTLVSPKQVEQLSGIVPERFLILYNSPPLEEVQGEPGSELTMVYVGTLGRERCDSLLKLIELAVKTGYKFVIAGFGECEDLMRKISESVKGVSFLGRVSRDEALRLVAKAHLVASYYDPRITFNHVIGLPNKFLDALMVGRAVLVAEGTYLGELVEEYGVGVAVNLNEMDEAVKRVKELTKEELMRRGARGRELFLRKFTWEKASLKYKLMVSELLSRKGRGGSQRNGTS